MVNIADYPDKMAFYLAIRQSGVTDIEILSAIEAVSRKMFLPEILHPFAYSVEAIQLDEDVRLEPIAVLARQLDLLKLEQSHKVLEYGSGSGYTLAVMGQLCRRLFGLERVRYYAHDSVKKLQAARVYRANVIHGYTPEAVSRIGKFDRILVSCAIEESHDMLQEIVNLLTDDGLMIAPLIDETGEEWLSKLYLNSNHNPPIIEKLFRMKQTKMIFSLG